MALIAAHTFDAAAIFAAHPPVLRHRWKKRVFEIATAGATPSGDLRVSRWSVGAPTVDLPPNRTTLEILPGIFTYEPRVAGATEWHLNFADPYLFFAYGSAAFAQDEIQVAEHPILGSLREALVAQGIKGLWPQTTDPGDVPTPVLVSNVERHCTIALEGIYGRAFDRASKQEIEAAVTPIRPPARNNILAMAAPRGSGPYLRRELRNILETATTGFAAAKMESAANARVVIHTGHWGTGAFGGDRMLMAILQMIAARIAGIDRLVYHAVDEAGVGPVERARFYVQSKAISALVAVSDLLDYIERTGFVWGVSDGN